MSGGSWDYFYSRLEEVAGRLEASQSPLRRAFGDHLLKCAKALHDIEWVDSCDNSKGSENLAIRAVLADTATDKGGEQIRSELTKLRDGLNELLLTPTAHPISPEKKK